MNNNYKLHCATDNKINSGIKLADKPADKPTPKPGDKPAPTTDKPKTTSTVNK